MSVFAETFLKKLYAGDGYKHIEQHKKYLKSGRLRTDVLRVGRREEMLTMYTVAALSKEPSETWASLFRGPFPDFSWTNRRDVTAVLEKPVTASKEICDSLSNKIREHFVSDRRVVAQRTSRIEGSSRCDVLVTDNRIRVYIESKLMSDIDLNTKYVMDRNQIARLIDVGLAAVSDNVDRFFFVLLTPRRFKTDMGSRLYYFKMNQYTNDPSTLRADIPRFKLFDESTVKRISERIGWITWEDCLTVVRKSGNLDEDEMTAFENLYRDLNLWTDV